MAASVHPFIRLISLVRRSGSDGFRHCLLFRPGPLLQQLSGRVDGDGGPAAGLFAEAAAGALLLVEDGHAEEVAHLLRLTQAQGIEGADLDAELAAAADAVVLDDDGLGPLFPGERAADVTRLVQDGFGRADDAAGAAVDAKVGVDDVELVADSGDGLGGAALGTSGTTDAGLDDDIGHATSPAAGSGRPISQALYVLIRWRCNFLRRPLYVDRASLLSVQPYLRQQ